MLITLAISSLAFTETLMVGNFESGDLSGWQEKKFSGKTAYEIVSVDGIKALHAKSSSSASGMFKEMDVDLEKTPYMNWRWKISNTYGPVNEKTKDGDDYPARVYVIFSAGIFFWKTKALNYVWSGSEPEGSSWPNAFTPKSRMIAAHTGEEDAGRWVTEKVNVRDDAKRYFGEDIKKAHAVALMTDSDNGGGKAEAWYGDIYFTSE